MDTFSLIPSARASLVVKSASLTVAFTFIFRSPGSLTTSVEERRADVLRVVVDAGLGRHHPRLAVDQPHGRVDGSTVGAREPGPDQLRELLLVEVGHQRAVLGLHAERRREVGRAEGDPGLVEDQRDRTRDGRVGELVEPVLHVGLADVGLGRGEGQLGGVPVDVRRLERCRRPSSGPPPHRPWRPRGGRCRPRTGRRPPWPASRSARRARPAPRPARPRPRRPRRRGRRRRCSSPRAAPAPSCGRRRPGRPWTRSPPRGPPWRPSSVRSPRRR